MIGKQILPCCANLKFFNRKRKSLYCLKCSNTLVTLENACWVCEEPIDPSKPVKPILVEGIEDGKEISDINKEK